MFNAPHAKRERRDAAEKGLGSSVYGLAVLADWSRCRILAKRTAGIVDNSNAGYSLDEDPIALLCGL